MGVNKSVGGAVCEFSAGNDPLADKMYEEGDLAVVDALSAVAGERGLPSAQIALAWLLGKPAVTAPIVGATKLRHVDDPIAAVGLTLQADEIGRVDDPYRPHPVLGHD